MKRSFLTFALLATVAASMAFAVQKTPEVPKPSNSYVYYIENDCDKPVTCNAEYEGPICADIFSGQVVYDAPGCVSGHEVINVLGRLPL